MIREIIVLNGGEGDYVYQVGGTYYKHVIEEITQEDSNMFVAWFDNGDSLTIISTNALVYKTKSKPEFY